MSKPEPVAKLHASGKSMILAIPCQNLLAGSTVGGEDILEEVAEPPTGLRKHEKVQWTFAVRSR